MLSIPRGEDGILGELLVSPAVSAFMDECGGVSDALSPAAAEHRRCGQPGILGGLVEPSDGADVELVAAQSGLSTSGATTHGAELPVCLLAGDGKLSGG